MKIRFLSFEFPSLIFILLSWTSYLVGNISSPLKLSFFISGASKKIVSIFSLNYSHSILRISLYIKPDDFIIKLSWSIKGHIKRLSSVLNWHHRDSLVSCLHFTFHSSLFICYVVVQWLKFVSEYKSWKFLSNLKLSHMGLHWKTLHNCEWACLIHLKLCCPLLHKQQHHTDLVLHLPILTHEERFCFSCECWSVLLFGIL